MPTITVTSPKGGSGKTTLALVLATMLAEHKWSVVLVDADPNRPLVSWVDGGFVDGLQVTSADEASIAEVISVASLRADWVVVDTEGTASLAALRAVALADLVLIPITPSPLDSIQAGRLVRAIHAIRDTAGRIITHRVIFTRTPVVTKTRVERLLIEEIGAMDIPIMSTQLHARSPFIAIFTYRCSLTELSVRESEGVASAIENAKALMDEVVIVLDCSREHARPVLSSDEKKVLP